MTYSHDDRDQQLIAKLDTIIAILQLAFRDQIEAARQKILTDPVAASILEHASDGWIDAGELRSRVAEETKQSERTVSRRLSVLLAQRALEQAGAGPKIRYRATGII